MSPGRSLNQELEKQHIWKSLPARTNCAYCLVGWLASLFVLWVKGSSELGKENTFSDLKIDSVQNTLPWLSWSLSSGKLEWGPLTLVSMCGGTCSTTVCWGMCHCAAGHLCPWSAGLACARAWVQSPRLQVHTVPGCLQVSTYENELSSDSNEANNLKRLN